MGNECYRNSSFSEQDEFAIDNTDNTECMGFGDFCLTIINTIMGDESISNSQQTSLGYNTKSGINNKKDQQNVTNTLSLIDNSCRTLELKITHFEEQELNNKRKAVQEANKKKSNGKRRALYHLKLAKMYERKQKSLEDIQLTLGGLKIEISTAHIITTTVASLESGNNILKKLTTRIDNLNIEDIMDNIKESIESLNDTNTILSEDLSGNTYDDKELEEELNKLIETSSFLPSIEEISLDSNQYDPFHQQQKTPNKNNKKNNNSSNVIVSGIIPSKKKKKRFSTSSKKKKNPEKSVKRKRSSIFG